MFQFLFKSQFKFHSLERIEVERLLGKHIPKGRLGIKVCQVRSTKLLNR
ncbi:MAG TPA: hypothetical protein VN461_15995 [Vicinamibacteria bacterium]|nr:hypothetical protein [Vicinamibacteria bacterium]